MPPGSVASSGLSASLGQTRWPSPGSRLGERQRRTRAPATIRRSAQRGPAGGVCVVDGTRSYQWYRGTRRSRAAAPRSLYLSGETGSNSPGPQGVRRRASFPETFWTARSRIRSEEANRIVVPPSSRPSYRSSPSRSIRTRVVLPKPPAPDTSDRASPPRHSLGSRTRTAAGRPRARELCLSSAVP